MYEHTPNSWSLKPQPATPTWPWHKPPHPDHMQLIKNTSHQFNCSVNTRAATNCTCLKKKKKKFFNSFISVKLKGEASCSIYNHSFSKIVFPVTYISRLEVKIILFLAVDRRRKKKPRMWWITLYHKRVAAVFARHISPPDKQTWYYTAHVNAALMQHSVFLRGCAALPCSWHPWKTSAYRVWQHVRTVNGCFMAKHHEASRGGRAFCREQGGAAGAALMCWLHKKQK